MTPVTFDSLLEDADAHARAGDWQATFESLTQADRLNPNHPGTLTGIGTALIQLGQANAALPFFQRVARQAGDSPEAQNNLGVAYGLVNQWEKAEAAYRKALALDKEHAPAWKNLALACVKQERFPEGVQILAALVQADPREMEARLMLAECYEMGGDAVSARTLYEAALTLQPDNMQAQAALARLAPAPITDPNRIARPEHAKKLAGLKSLKKAAPPAAAPEVSAPVAPPLSIIIYAPADIASDARFSAAAQALVEQGARLKLATAFSPGEASEYAVGVFARPHTSEGVMHALAEFARAGKRLLIDLDDDFHALPPDHSGFKLYGPGHPDALRKLEAVLAQAHLLTVPNETLAERYRRYVARVAVVPNGWSRTNTLWSKAAPRRATLNIGWVGRADQRGDVSLMKHDVLRFIRETPSTMLVIGGDPGAYEAFAALPEQRRLFLPLVPHEEYPFMLAHFDILLMPLRDTPFNQAKSDTRLMEAGIRRLPWIASPQPAFAAWGAGGIVLEKAGPEGWYAALKQLAENPSLRKELGEAGHTKAETREGAALAALWREVLSSP